MSHRLAVIALVLATLAGGCLGDFTPATTSTPIPTPVPGRYAPGDLLQGDLSGAGFDDPRGTPAGAAIVILEYRPVPGEYVYSLVRPEAGGWAYVYPSGDFVSTIARDRSTFESYRLERTGSVDLREVHAPPGDATPRPT